MTITQDKPTRILFVCLANMCRSPMAEVLANMRSGGTVAARSAGVAPSPGPVFPETLAVMKKMLGADLSGHKPRHVLEYRIEDFDYVIAMDCSVFMRMTELVEIPENKLYGWEIPDPCGLGLQAYEQAAELIEKELDRFLQNRDMEKIFPARKT